MGLINKKLMILSTYQKEKEFFTRAFRFVRCRRKNKKAHLVNQMSFLNIVEDNLEALDLTYLSRYSVEPGITGWSWHLANVLYENAAGCQGFKGPYPSAFLDK
jgi:hypothetical protein